MADVAHTFLLFLDFFGPHKKSPGMAPNGAGSFFFQLIQTLPKFWATRILILRIFFGFFGVPNFWLGPSLGPPTWAQLGPTHLDPAWALSLGPSLGPPTWARLGPIHLGLAWGHPLGPGWGPPTPAVNLENLARLEFQRGANVNRAWQATLNAACHVFPR